MSGEVYLIGAGCGDYDLITLRGIRYLKKCNTVIYDALIDDRLLEYVPENAERIFVGKRSGGHSMPQEDINSLLVEKALAGRHIARLKGGDPFVFGRGGEEISELKKNNIPYTVVPGITSAAAVPGLAGIPVTFRKESRSFHVITAHTTDDLKPGYFEKYAKLDGTLVFLMGLHNLKLIGDSLTAAGFSEDTPVAVVSQGATHKQKIIKGDLGNIYDKSSSAGIKPPAVIIVGNTVNYDLISTLQYPLSGVSITAAGSRHFTDKFSLAAEEYGADVHKIRNIKIRKYADDTEFENAVRNIGNYSCIALTSVHGANIFFNKLKEFYIDIRKLNNIAIAAVGSETASYLSEKGIIADIVPEKYDSSSLGKTLVNRFSEDERILILNAEKSSPEMTSVLDENYISYDNIKIYHTEKIICDDRYVDDDYIVFGSSSGAEALFESNIEISENTTAVCIGTPTEKTLKSLYSGKYITAKEHTVKGIIDAIIYNERSVCHAEITQTAFV